MGGSTANMETYGTDAATATTEDTAAPVAADQVDDKASDHVGE